jgi:hypothetical protein
VVRRFGLAIGGIALGTCLTRPALAEEDTAGEIGAALGPGRTDDRLLVAGEARAGIYFIDGDLPPLLIGNRLGGDLRFRALYGENASGAPVGHFLFGVAPSFTGQFGGLYRLARGFRVPSLVGLALPEPGLWLRSDGPARFYLGWRAPVFWLVGGEAGLEVAPSFVWAPAGEWLAMLSFGGFLK